MDYALPDTLPTAFLCHAYCWEKLVYRATLCIGILERPVPLRREAAEACLPLPSCCTLRFLVNQEKLSTANDTAVT
jgi:hypothetical protein